MLRIQSFFGNDNNSIHVWVTETALTLNVACYSRGVRLGAARIGNTPEDVPCPSAKTSYALQKRGHCASCFINICASRHIHINVMKYHVLLYFQLCPLPTRTIYMLHRICPVCKKRPEPSILLSRLKKKKKGPQSTPLLRNILLTQSTSQRSCLPDTSLLLLCGKVHQVFLYSCRLFPHVPLLRNKLPVCS